MEAAANNYDHNSSSGKSIELVLDQLLIAVGRVPNSGAEKMV